MSFNPNQNVILDVLMDNYPEFIWEVGYENHMLNIMCQKIVNEKIHSAKCMFDPLAEMEINHLKNIANSIVAIVNIL